MHCRYLLTLLGLVYLGATLSFTQDGPQAPELQGLTKINMIDAMWFA